MASSLNSTQTPILASQTWSGSLESCKNYSCISLSLYADQNVKIYLNHLDKNSNLQFAEDFQYTAGETLFKQVITKSTHFQVSLESKSETDQTVCRLVTKLSNSSPDNLNVRLDSAEDSVKAMLATSEGNLSSSSGKLLVSQNVLSSESDSVVTYGVNSVDGSKLPLNVDGNGKLNVNVTMPSAPVYVQGPWCTSSLTNSPQQLLGGAGKVLRVSAYNDSNQYIFVRVYDSASTPLNSDTPKCIVAVKHGEWMSAELGFQVIYGLWVVAASNYGATGDWGTVASDQLTLNVVVEVLD